MASRKEEKERLRQARIEAEKREASEAQRRLMLGYLVAGLLAVAVLAGLVLVIAGSGGGGGGDAGPEEAHIVPETGTPPEGAEPDDREGTTPPAIQQADLAAAAKAADCELQLDLPDEGNSHLRPNEDPPDYETDPPTSGDHIVPPLQAADGAYIDPVEPVNFVHSLEHGRVVILYDPELPEEDQLMLKGVFDESPAGMLMFPNSDMPYDVAVAAWTQLAGCEQYDDGVLDVIRDFRDTYRGQGPEPVPF
jgi:Protein of unknown function (DUF3105)